MKLSISCSIVTVKNKTEECSHDLSLSNHKNGGFHHRGQGFGAVLQGHDVQSAKRQLHRDNLCTRSIEATFGIAHEAKRTWIFS
jgi:hypothetical protein